MSSEEAEAMAVSVRERLSHRKLKIEEGEVAGIELTLFLKIGHACTWICTFGCRCTEFADLIEGFGGCLSRRKPSGRIKGWNLLLIWNGRKRKIRKRETMQKDTGKTLGAFAERARPATGKTAAGSDKDCIQPQDCKDWQGRVGSSASTGKGIPDNSGNGSSYCICDGFGTVEQESSFPY